MSEHIIINADRSVTVPQSLRKAGVQFDHNVNTITFDCPRYCSNVDLSTLIFYVNYLLPDNTKGSCKATNVVVDETDENLLHFDWTIFRNVTGLPGTLTCLVCAKKTNAEGNEENHWNSSLFKTLSVDEGMENSEIVEEEYPDVITQMLLGLESTDQSVTELGRKVGNLEDLDTKDKTNLVAAVNEVNSSTTDLGKKNDATQTRLEQLQKHVTAIAGAYEITWTDGGYISRTDGTVQAEKGSSYSNFVPVESGTRLIIANTMTSDTEYNAFYDAGETFVSSFSNATGALIVPEGVTQMRLSKYTSATVMIASDLQSEIDAAEEKIDNAKAEIGELKSDLANYINVPHIVDFGIEKETGKAYNTTNGTYVENLNGFECASIPVNQNDTLIISGWGGDSNSYKPRFWSDTEIIETISTTEDVFTDVTVTVPIGANRLLINGRSAIQSIIVKKFSQNDVSKDFYASYGKTVGVNYSSEKTVDVFIKDYSKGKDLVVRMWGKASNNLPDFGNIGTVENDGIYVLDSIGDKTIESITSGTTDFLSPSVVYAINNADGDYLGNTDDKLTGGWHGFNNATSGATATARNIKFVVSCDGNPLNIGEKARGNEVTIEITNRLQGSNTEKQDGSGREIVEQYFRITIGDGFKIEVDGEIRALEDIAYQTYYGLSLYHTMPNDVYFVGCRADRGAKSVTSVNRCGDTNCVGIRQVGEENTLEMLFNSSYDLGTQYANAWGNSCITSSNKSYLVLIKGKSDGTERLQLNGGDRVYWRGYYNFYPTN